MPLRIAALTLTTAALCLAAAIAQQPAVEYQICESPIYCAGEILDTIQMARLNNDSKTFVDQKLKFSPQQTVENFRVWKLNNTTPTRDAVRQFVADNFDAEGSEFQHWTPSDHNIDPPFLQLINDAPYRDFARQLNDKWLMLGRNMTEDVARNPQLYSIIYVPNPVIVPGGRFREFYYWDSYWIMLGLLHCQMHTTVRGMLGNFLSIVDRYGFIPNAGRVYYLGRSQPPLLIPMMKEYLDASDDLAFVRQSIDTLEREFAYWSQPGKSVQVRNHTLVMYTDRSHGPRPEAYWEDRQQGEQLATEAERADLYAELKAGAESGMDFSSRWFIRNGTNNGTLVDLKARSIVPVDLNAVLQRNAVLLAEFYERLGNADKVAKYLAIAEEKYRGLQAVFWHEDVGAWLDWDLLNGKRRDYFVPTNLAPLWMGAFDRKEAATLAGKVLAYIRREGLDEFVAGVPNSLVASGEQWDYPNVWPNMQHLLITALSNLGTEEARELAFKWASKWVFTNYVAFNKTGNMYEKYSANEIGLGGSGGEYEVQIGFGWSNGAVLDLLRKYGDRLSSKSAAATSHVSLGLIGTVALGLLSRWLH